VQFHLYSSNWKCYYIPKARWLCMNSKTFAVCNKMLIQILHWLNQTKPLHIFFLSIHLHHSLKLMHYIIQYGYHSHSIVQITCNFQLPAISMPDVSWKGSNLSWCDILSSKMGKLFLFQSRIKIFIIRLIFKYQYYSMTTNG